MLHTMKNFMHRGRYGGGGYGSSDEEEMYDRRDETEAQRMERQKRAGERRRQKEQERKQKKESQQSMMKTYVKQVKNNNKGFSFKVCDMERLRRFIVLGSEFNTYYVTSTEITIDTVQCVKRLIQNGKCKHVLDTIESYSREGRVAKEEPLLTVLAICALHDQVEVKQAAYEKVNIICNIPTKLFKFIDMTHAEIVRKRLEHPPPPQPYTGKTRKRKLEEVGQAQTALGALKITETGENITDETREPSENVDETRQPSENVDETQVVEPPAKKKKKKKKKKETKEFKKVRVTASKSLGWGRMRRNGVARFYMDERKDACRLLYLMTKYKQRHNWDHKTVMQYSHPKMKGEEGEEKNLVIKYCTRGYENVAEEMRELSESPDVGEKMKTIIEYIQVVDTVKNLKTDNEGDEEKLVEILQKYGGSMTNMPSTDTTTEGGGHGGGRRNPIQVVREHLPTPFLNSPKIWEMMLAGMPMTAMIRNLGKMSSLNMFTDNPTNTNLVLNALKDIKRLRGARVHPVKLLIAAETYYKGKGDKGSLQWPVNQDIFKALDAAFYKSFKSPELGQSFTTGLKHMLALDVSGSMQGGGCVGCPAISPAKATAAMAMVTWNIEQDVQIMGFGGSFRDLKPMLKKDMLVHDAMHTIGQLNFGATDCSLPMVFALMEKREVDVFIVYTDSETRAEVWKDPMEALKAYNFVMKRNAKLIVCAMATSGFTIADPDSDIALDIVGFDANVPEIIYNFVTGSKETKCEVCEECKDARK